MAVRSAHSAVYMIAIVAVRKAERKNNRVHIVRTAVDWIKEAMAIVAVRKAVIEKNNIVHIVHTAVDWIKDTMAIAAVRKAVSNIAVMQPLAIAKYSAVMKGKTNSNKG